MTKQENALLTIRSTQNADGQSDRSDIDSVAHYAMFSDRVEISYTELEEDGSVSGETCITVHQSGVVSIHKTGFTETVMIMEEGKTHPALYQTMVGNMEMQLSTLEVRSDFRKNGGRLRLRYLIHIGGQYSALNTIDLRVKLRDHA